MNYPIPGNSFASLATFPANNTYNLGQFIKPGNAVATMTVDYTQLTPAVTVAKVSFLIDVGGNPRLLISSPSLAADILTFTIAQGIPGKTYTIEIIATLLDGEVRSDFLTIVVPDNDDGCCCLPVIPVPGSNQLPQFGTDYLRFVNSRLQYFVASYAPQSANIMDQWWDTANGVLYEYVTDGAHAFWKIIENDIVETPVTLYKNSSLYYVVGASPQQAFPLNIPDVFGNVYTLTTSSVIEVFAGGNVLMPDDGTGRGGYTINQTTNTVNLLYPAGPGEVIQINLFASQTIVINNNSIVTEVPAVLGLNSLGPLSNAPDGRVLILFISGTPFFTVGADAAFHVSGKNIIWTSTVYSIAPGSTAVCVYTYAV